ncbi:hypothetical protein D187_003898 [Cystobacter fuscus DSM 2262]|uniref:Exo-alpha-sialidase n=2 Tax=Cystobacter fuscus TaxID=43 RepID=S9P5E1_CYSF2|nr:hypothetical protein D187_003898 [Cystobacter fuscus DSM 2262]
MRRIMNEMIRRMGIRRGFARALVRVTWLAAGLALIGMTGSAAQAQTLLTAYAKYPRIRLLPSGELIASVLAFDGGVEKVKIFSSTNNGASFTHVGTINDANFTALGSSSPSLFYVEQQVGTALPKGTLILGIVVDKKECTSCRARINIYKSTDTGRSWTFLSEAVRSATSGGLWEPDFSLAKDGSIVMHYADESSPCCDQKLVRRRTSNGVEWVGHSNTVALGTSSKDYRRPGMPVVSKLNNGNYLLTYEICGAGHNCDHYYKISSDGWDYGATDTEGTRMQDALGRYFTNTPVNKVLPGGAILWIGQYLRVQNGNASNNNGLTIFKSANGSPNGPWTEIPAPVTLPNPVTDGCEGFTPGLQWVNGGATLVQLQTRAENGTCNVYFGTGPTN